MSKEIEESWTRYQKPLPLQRLLLENGGNISRKNCVRVSPTSPQQSMHDKENVPELAKFPEKRYGAANCRGISKEVGETSELQSHEALSSTLAVQQSILSTPERLKPSLFSTSNLSSISLMGNASGHTSQDLLSPTQEVKTKTPGRRDELIGMSGFKTPSSGSSKTPSSRGTRTPSSRGTRASLVSSRGTKTPGSSSSPWSSGSGIRYNPFESHHTAEALHLPLLSPRIFHIVESPSKEESVNGRFWNIEQQAELYPAVINEDSPVKQSILYKNYSHETESETQEKIELYFQNYHDVTSPPDLPPTGPLLVDSPESDVNLSYTQPDSGKCSKWTQTCLTLPPILPSVVEQVLRQHGLIFDISEEPNVLSNSTLRRKLFNVDMAGNDLDESQPQSSDDEESDCGSPYHVMTPGKVMRTPVTRRAPDGNTAQWSSSPLRSKHRTSLSPPDMGSPMFSPIAKGLQTSQQSMDQSSIMLEERPDATRASDDEKEFSDKEHSLLYKTAEIQNITESCMMDTDSNSGAAWMLTLPTQGEEENQTESRVDTGYTTNTASSIQPSTLQEDSGAAGPSQSDMDSGVSTSQPPDLTVSLILPAPPQPHQQPNNVLMSYGAGNSNDISVGFPLGSSTPTKR